MPQPENITGSWLFCTWGGGCLKAYQMVKHVNMKYEHIYLKLGGLLPVYTDVADFTCMWRITLHGTKNYQKHNKKVTLQGGGQ